MSLKHIYACSPSTTRGKPSVLSADPKGQTLVYACGKNVIIRNVEDLLKCDIYTEHAKDVSVAKFSPSGFYIASGDATGKIRIWDTVNAEHILKVEVAAISGSIADLAWSQDSQRIVTVGDGRESFAKVFMWDSGSTVGEIGGHAKRLSSCDFRSARPFRIATGGEDNLVNFFEGPPFKFKQSNRQHSNFVNCVRFSPDGRMFLSVGSDSKGFFYDGTTGETIGELRGELHTGSIYSCAFSPDGTRVATASADKTVRVWEAGSGAHIATFTVADAPQVEHMQMGVLWLPAGIISVSLSGDLNLFDPATPGRPRRVIKGHNKSITALTYDPATNSLLSASFDAVVNRFVAGEGNVGSLGGKGHTNQITGISAVGGSLYTCSMDDTLRITPAAGMTWGDVAIPLGGPANDVSGCINDPSLAVAVTNSAIVLVRGGAMAGQAAAPYKANAVSVHPSGNMVAVAGDDKKIHIYALPGLTETAAVEMRGAVHRVRYSACGKWLAAADANRETIVYDAISNAVVIKDWVFHSSRITALEWAPDSSRVATGSLDSNVVVWSIADPATRVVIKGAHSGGVSAVTFVDPNTVASGGADCCVKTWTL